MEVAPVFAIPNWQTMSNFTNGILLTFLHKTCCDQIHLTQNWHGCSTAVENTPAEQTLEVMGSNPAGCWAFFLLRPLLHSISSLSSYFPSPVDCPKSGPSKGGASLTMCCEINIIKWMPCWAAWGKTGSMNSDRVKHWFTFSYLNPVGYGCNFRRSASPLELKKFLQL